MSYDLNFWKQKTGVKLDPQKTYERLSKGETVEGLDDIPIDQMIQRVCDAFAIGWTRLDPVTWEGPEKSFQLYTTPQFLRVDCGGMTGEDMNVFIDIGIDFGCPLYDPQTGTRFEG